MRTKRLRYVGAIFLLWVMVLMSGCWDKQEFTAISFATAMAIDRDESGYAVAVKVVMPKNFAQSGENEPDWVIDGHGESLYQALDDLDQRAPRRIYWGHMKLILFGNGVLKDNVFETTELLLAVNDFNRDTAVTATERQAAEILQVITDLSQVNDFYAYSLLEDAEKEKKGSLVTLHDISVRQHYASQCLYLPRLAIDEKQSSNQKKEASSETEQKSKQDKVLILAGGFAVGADGVRWQIEPQQEQGYAWLMYDIKNGVLQITQEPRPTFRILNSRRTYRWQEDTDTLLITIRGELNLANTPKRLTTLNEEKMWEQMANRKIEQQVSEIIAQAQQNKQKSQ